MLALIVAGEGVFVLPFVVARVFRPTLLDVFGLSNLQLGTAFSVYGGVAMLSYLAGGPLADRFPARSLICAALLATALGGLLFASLPGPLLLGLLYGFWGLSSILLFWAALIRATREWGGVDEQGRAYGLLDGGRGLFAALLATLTVAVFAQLLPVDVASATREQRIAALQQVILLCTAFTALAALLAWWTLPPRGPVEGPHPAPSWQGILRAARLPGVRLQALVIVCAYVAYKMTDNFGLYARDVLGYDEVSAAQLGTLSFWMRPLAAVAAGLLADRIRTSRVLVGGFALIALGCVALAAGVLPFGIPTVLAATVLGTSLGVYAVRAVYYAVMGEARVPMAITGSAVGLVSVVGYTPDIFFGPLMGYLLDRSPGAAGHEQVFFVVAGFAVVGLCAALAFHRITREPIPGPVQSSASSVTMPSR